MDSFSEPFTLLRGDLERAADYGFIKVTANLVRGLGLRSPKNVLFPLPFSEFDNFHIKLTR